MIEWYLVFVTGIVALLVPWFLFVLLLSLVLLLLVIQLPLFLFLPLFFLGTVLLDRR